jgi:outer membrane protein assembly factor BamB
MKTWALPMASAVAAISATMSAIADDWPQWRGPNGNGVSSETNWFQQWPPKELWRIDVGAAYGGLVVSEGRMYTTGWSNNQDWVHCYDAVSGERVWSYPFCYDDSGYRGPFSTPAVAGDHVYALSKAGEACCLNRHTGELVWSKTFADGANGFGVSGSPIVDGDRVYFAAGGACVAVSRTAPYDVLWTSPALRCGYSSPVAFRHGTMNLVAVVTERLADFPGGALVAIDASGSDHLAERHSSFRRER